MDIYVKIFLICSLLVTGALLVFLVVASLKDIAYVKFMSRRHGRKSMS